MRLALADPIPAAWPANIDTSLSYTSDATDDLPLVDLTGPGVI